MKHIEVAQFLVTQGEMQSFTSAMQMWERLALNDEAGPEQHAVLVEDNNPCKVVAVTQFADSERAAAFKAKASPRRCWPMWPPIATQHPL